MALEREDALEEPVERHSGTVKIVAATSAQTLPAAHGNQKGKQQRVEVAHAHHAEAGALDGGAQPARGIPAAMAEDFIVSAPEPSIRGHGHHKKSALADAGARRAERRD